MSSTSWSITPTSPDRARSTTCWPSGSPSRKPEAGSRKPGAGSLPLSEIRHANASVGTDGGPRPEMPGPFLEDAMKRRSIQLLAGAVFVAAAGMTAIGSSHREAPGITGRPKLDGTDFYAFRSYEPGREGYVTLIANYIPLQDAYGGPNFF